MCAQLPWEESPLPGFVEGNLGSRSWIASWSMVAVDRRGLRGAGWVVGDKDEASDTVAEVRLLVWRMRALSAAAAAAAVGGTPPLGRIAAAAAAAVTTPVGSRGGSAILGAGASTGAEEPSTTKEELPGVKAAARRETEALAFW